MFSQPGCAPCKEDRPVFSQLAKTVAKAGPKTLRGVFVAYVSVSPRSRPPRPRARARPARPHERTRQRRARRVRRRVDCVCGAGRGGRRGRRPQVDADGGGPAKLFDIAAYPAYRLFVPHFSTADVMAGARRWVPPPLKDGAALKHAAAVEFIDDMVMAYEDEGLFVITGVGLGDRSPDRQNFMPHSSCLAPPASDLPCAGAGEPCCHTAIVTSCSTKLKFESSCDAWQWSTPTRPEASCPAQPSLTQAETRTWARNPRQPPCPRPMRTWTRSTCPASR